MRICHLCGYPVDHLNDAVALKVVVEDNPINFFEFKPQHLFSGENGCPGTPDIAQYLDDQQARQGSYNEEKKQMYREAYQRLLNDEWSPAIIYARLDL